MGLFLHVWDTHVYEQAKLAAYYKFDIDESQRIISLTERHFKGTIPTAKIVEEDEYVVIAARPDYLPKEVVTDAVDFGEYIPPEGLKD